MNHISELLSAVDTQAFFSPVTEPQVDVPIVEILEMQEKEPLEVLDVVQLRAAVIQARNQLDTIISMLGKLDTK